MAHMGAALLGGLQQGGARLHLDGDVVQGALEVDLRHRQYSSTECPATTWLMAWFITRSTKGRDTSSSAWMASFRAW